MRPCPRCGYHNPDESQFCSRCGAPLSGATLASSQVLPRKRGWVWVVGTGVGLVGAILFVLLHMRNPLAEPAWTTEAMVHAMQAGDLSGLETTLTPDRFKAFVRYFGEWKYRRVREIYDKMYRVGIRTWKDYRMKAEGLAAQGYERLHQRVMDLGREALQELPFEQKQPLLLDRQKLEVFLYREGHARLPPEERRRIPDIEAFRQRQDRQRFILQQMWTYLPEEDRSFLGSARTLSDEDTPEKMQLIDRIALQGLDDLEREDIGGVSRAELESPESFEFRYGRPVAADALSRLGRLVQVRMLRSGCVYPEASEAGSLFRRRRAGCTIIVSGSGGHYSVSLTLRRVRTRWLVADTEPPLWEVVAGQVRRDLDTQYQALVQQMERHRADWDRLRNTSDATEAGERLLQTLRTMLRNRREAQQLGHPTAPTEVGRLLRDLQHLQTQLRERRS